MYTYNWLNNKKIDNSIFTIWSLFISILIKSFYSAIHVFILPHVQIPDALKIIVFSSTGLLLAILLTYLRRTKLFYKILCRINNKSINDDIFDDIIDYSKKTMMNIYIKSSDIYYVGRFSYREENGIDSWISLIEYSSVNKKTNNPVFNSEAGGLNSSVVINLKDIERTEIIYEKDSDVWNRLIGSKSNDVKSHKGANKKE